MSRASVQTFDVARGVMPQELIDDALRILHADVMHRGLSAQELNQWLWGAHWFPHLNERPEILGLVDGLPAQWRDGQICDPQILLQFPHTGADLPEITFHTDQEPDWAQGRRYLRIVGVPLSPWRKENGGLLARVGDETVAVEVDPGDVVCMAPDLLHSGGVNLTGAIRYAVYFRFLEP